MPLIQAQVVQKFGWLSAADFSDLVTIAEMTPGPIAINAATFVGNQVAGIGGAVAGISMGTTGTLEEAWSLLSLFCTVFIPLCVGGLIADSKRNRQMKANLLVRRNDLTKIAQKYNDVTSLLEQSFKEEKRGLGRNSKEALRKQYEKKYFQNKEAFDRERLAYLRDNSAQTETGKRFSSYWKWVVSIGLLTQLMACSYTLGINTEPEGSQPVVATTPEDTQPWSADNITLPHLTDGSRYVSNPDKVVSENTEMLLNQWFRKLEDSLQIESAVILVNHVANDDPFRMAQDIGNKYGVGKNDRGLIIVLGYQDHSLNISPGRALEADLTDAECGQLSRQYVVPSMKAEQPDSGMLYLAEAIYNTLQKKALPEMSVAESQADSEGDEQFGIISLYLLLFSGWIVLIIYLLNRYRGTTGSHLFAANPFVKEPEVVFGGGGFGGRF
jgi:uncharacterized membrane protein YgcG